MRKCQFTTVVKKTNIHRTISFHIFTAEPPTTSEFWYLLQKGHLTSRVMRVLESFKLCLTTSFITHSFPRLWINKQTPHSYREFNPEELTKRLHRSSKDVLAAFCVRRSPVRSEVWFCTSTNLRISRSPTCPLPADSELRFWVCRGVESCAQWDLDHMERLGAVGHLWHKGPCGRRMYYVSHYALLHWGTPTVCPYMWLVSVEKGA